MKKTLWMPVPEDHDYAAAAAYLSLIVEPADAAALAGDLHTAPMTSFKAKDIFRASGLAMPGKDNFHVARNLEKIDEGKPLSPILLVRDPSLRKVHIADGYHRLCAVYRRSEDDDIPSKIVSMNISPARTDHG